MIGSGSLSFEMIRSLVERLPIMITPKWVRVMAQPIAIDDLLEYLLAALRLPISRYAVYEIGGTDQVSYADIMRAVRAATRVATLYAPGARTHTLSIQPVARAGHAVVRPRGTQAYRKHHSPHGSPRHRRAQDVRPSSTGN